ncbi:hypothetical protein GCM10009788_44950 [Nocardioides humi]|uniref:Uncharacterized protein n=1 Tax=Nocardioides humi TaxID=449461 RepID=A0ABN2BC70_9ACTN
MPEKLPWSPELKTGPPVITPSSTSAQAITSSPTAAAAGEEVAAPSTVRDRAVAAAVATNLHSVFMDRNVGRRSHRVKNQILIREFYGT